MGDCTQWLSAQCEAELFSLDVIFAWHMLENLIVWESFSLPLSLKQLIHFICLNVNPCLTDRLVS